MRYALLCLAAATSWLTSPTSFGQPALIVPAGVTSSTAAGDFFAAANLINGSGLSSAPVLTNYAGITHAAASAATAWVTDDPAPGGGDWYAEGNPDPELTFRLNQPYLLTGLVVWGYHFGNPNNNEAKDFTLEFSIDGGVTWQGAVQVSHLRTAELSEAFAWEPAVEANAVRLTITDNHYGAPGTGGGDRVGLGEVRFIGEPAPVRVPVIEVDRHLDMGSFAVDPGAIQLELPITNGGDEQALTILSASITGQDVDRFGLHGFPAQLAPGESGVATVSFDAAGTSGCFLAWLDIESNDPANPRVRVALTAAVDCIPPPPTPPVFSVPGGMVTEPFDLALSTATPGALVVYTTDGTRPSATNGMVYSTPLAIAGTTQVRAATLVPGQPPAGASEAYVYLAEDLRAYQSTLPILVVENFGAGTIPDKGWTIATQTGGGLRQVPRQPAVLTIHEPEPGTGSARLLSPSHLSTRIGIRVRGAFSSTWNPKPYSVETWDQQDQDQAVSPLGMPEESDWILYYPHPGYDRTLLYNTFIWELSRQTGRFAPRFRFVDVFVHEHGGDLSLTDRRGVYVLLEKVKRDGDRIDFEPLAEDGTTGGWLLSINRMDPEPAEGFPAPNGALSPQYFHTPGPDRIQQTPRNQPGQGDDIPRQYNAFINFEHPNGYEINPAQRNAVEAWHRDFEYVLYDDIMWLDPVYGYRRFLNTRDFIDYFQLLNLARQSDGMLLSMFPWVSSGDRKLHMGPMWDFNNGVYDRAGDPETTLYFRSDRLWYPRLFQDPSFMQEYIDRWFELRRGPLANLNMAAIIDDQAAEVTAALAAQQGISAGEWATRLEAMKGWLIRRADWIDAQYFQPPAFSHSGGIVPAGYLLVLTHSGMPPGTIYFTTDGSDPMPAPGAPSPGTPYQGSIELVGSGTIRARILSDAGQWSALNQATFVVGVPAGSTNLVISKIHYHPAEPAADSEFLELMNISGEDAVELTGVALTEGIRFTFGPGVRLAPGERTVVVKDPAAFEAEYGTGYAVAGTYEGRLDNGGERLVLMGADGAAIRDFDYGDDPPWPKSPDGDGPCLVLVAPEGNPDHANPLNWRPSANVGGTPGVSDATTFAGDPTADHNHNGLIDLLDYALATHLTGGAWKPSVTIDAQGYLVVSLRVNLVADDMTFQVELSEDLATWRDGEPYVTLGSRTDLGDGTYLLAYRSVALAAAFDWRFARFRVGTRW